MLRIISKAASIRTWEQARLVSVPADVEAVEIFVCQKQKLLFRQADEFFMQRA